MEASDESTVIYSGNIPEAYAPPEGVELFTKKWWAKIAAEDDFWGDLAYFVPKAVLRKRIKQNVVIDHDVRTRARKKEEERLARERRRTQALKATRFPEERDEPPSTQDNLRKSPTGTVASGDTASLSSVVPAVGEKGVKDVSYNDVVEKFECAKCGHFCLKAEMNPSNGSVCKQCVGLNAIKTDEMMRETSAVSTAKSPSRTTTARSVTAVGESIGGLISQRDLEDAVPRAAARAKEEVGGSERKRIKLEPVDNGSG